MISAQRIRFSAIGNGTVYDVIGEGYSSQRRTEPSWARQIDQALGRAKLILNVGAGTGSYERTGGVVALEPSTRMLAQRANTNPTVQGVAEALPFRTRGFDAVLGVLTLHHWNDLEAGLGELRRVAARQVLFVFESLAAHGHWLVDYFPEILDNEVEQNAPDPAALENHLQIVEVQKLWVSPDCVDGVAAAYWKRPEMYLRPEVQASMSALSLLSETARRRGTGRLRKDLADRTWHRRYAHLFDLDRADYGYRLVIAQD